MAEHEQTPDEAARRKQVSDRLRAPFPPEQIEQKQRRDYVAVEHVRQRLIEATDNQYDWELLTTEVRPASDEVAKRDDKATGEIWSVPVMVVTGRLTIPGLGSRCGTGTAALERGANEEAYKHAESDAVKRAAMAFGVGLQLYMGKTRPGAARTAPRQPDRPQSIGERAKAAITAADGQTLKAILDEANGHIGHWVQIIQASPSVENLTWLAEQMAARQVGNEASEQAIERRRQQLTAGKA